MGGGSPNSRYREFYHEIGNIEKFPFTYWLNGRWFLQIVDIHVGNFYMKLTGRWFPQIVQWESISNIYITKIVVLVSEPVRGRSRATELPCLKYVLFYAVWCRTKKMFHTVWCPAENRARRWRQGISTHLSRNRRARLILPWPEWTISSTGAERYTSVRADFYKELTKLIF